MLVPGLWHAETLLAPVLVRGKLHVIPLPTAFRGDTAGGAAILATKPTQNREKHEL